MAHAFKRQTTETRPSASLQEEEAKERSRSGRAAPAHGDRRASQVAVNDGRAGAERQGAGERGVATQIECRERRRKGGQSSESVARDDAVRQSAGI